MYICHVQQVTDIVLSPADAADENRIKAAVSGLLGISPGDIFYIRILRKSIDARKREIKINLKVLVYVNELPADPGKVKFEYRDVSGRPGIIIIGAGPAGLFAALRLIELGLKPVIFERGKKVEDRKADIGTLHKTHIINPDSNYCFGEGGAGAFSDGKLYTRSTKRGNVSKILEILHFHGAQGNILYDAHPHIGTNKLPSVISNIRKTIETAGGIFYFNTRVTDLVIRNGKVNGIITKNGDTYLSPSVILATGHSASDVYEFLDHNNIPLETKLFAMGVRVEHPQDLIDSIQYHGAPRGKYLPAASYAFTEQVGGRGVYSFCMCPGGFIVPASTGQDSMVVNGMSPSGRDNVLANSGIVVEITAGDLKEFQKHGPLAGLRLQQQFEKTAFDNGGGGLIAPSQRLGDFLTGKKSVSLPKSSYHPGLAASDFNSWMPPYISGPLSQAFRLVDKKMRGFITNEAIIIGVESRTSSPVRIPRNKNSFVHVSVGNLYPCGEGAGYAGGIVSSAIDGVNCAEKAAEKIAAN